MTVQNGTYQGNYLYGSRPIDSGAGMKKRATIRVRGLVQRGGYRDRIEEYAFQLGITGWVKNMPDRSVRIVAEGDEERLKEFVQRTRISIPPIVVTSSRPRYRPATGEFGAFQVIPDENPSQVADERANMAIRLLGETILAIRDVSVNVKAVSSDVKAVGADVKAVGSDIKAMDGHITGHIDRKVSETNSAIRSMHSDMNGSFGRLDKKYGEFGDTLKEVHQDIKGLRTDIRSIAAPRPKRAPRKASARHNGASKA